MTTKRAFIPSVLTLVMAFAPSLSWAQTAPASCDDAHFQADQQAFATGALQADQAEHVCGTVTRVLKAKRTRSGRHGYFYVDVGQGKTIEIVSDLDRMTAPSWPWVKIGDQADVVGRYYYDDSRRQGIDWTHRGTSRSWPQAGSITVNGVTYR